MRTRPRFQRRPAPPVVSVMHPSPSFLIVGGGIAGLSASIALASQGHSIELIEQNPAFQEVGAGLQLSPNAWRCMRQWGLEDALLEICSLPEAIVARNITTGEVLGRQPLAGHALRRFGAPYGTALRTDLHRILLNKAREFSQFSAVMGSQALSVQQDGSRVSVQLRSRLSNEMTADALLVADGARSKLAASLLPQFEPMRSGYTAYRGLLRQSALPFQLRTSTVNAWMGRHLHAITYPVQQGHFLNVVIVVSERILGHLSQRGPADFPTLLTTIEQQQPLFPKLKDLCLAINSYGINTMGGRWTEWPLQIRQPVRDPDELAIGRIALLGDAAHPMVPFLAQGAAMAIEDAEQLRQSLQAQPQLNAALAHYAYARVQRCGKVQRGALRNGRIFHLSGPLALGRNLVIKTMTQQAMDRPWLYAGGPIPASGL